MEPEKRMNVIRRYEINHISRQHKKATFAPCPHSLRAGGTSPFIPVLQCSCLEMYCNIQIQFSNIDERSHL